jgi:hypothetical protein
MLTKTLLSGALALGCAGLALDDFRREGDREAKDRLEGRAPPALAATDWINTEGEALDLAALRGNVVLLEFWGTW